MKVQKLGNFRPQFASVDITLLLCVSAWLSPRIWGLQLTAEENLPENLAMGKKVCYILALFLDMAEWCCYN